MLGRLRAQLNAMRMKQLMALATRTIYAEQFDLEALLARLSDGKGDVHRVRALIAVYAATRLTEPLSDGAVDVACTRLLSAEARVGRAEFETILGLYRELALLQWQQRRICILRGKLAHQQDPYSQAGGLYSWQRDRKGPIGREELNRCMELLMAVERAERAIRDKELELLMESNPREYLSAKEERENKALTNEIEAHQEKEMDDEHEEIIQQLERRLESILASSP
jgi:hypothetical protein